MKYNVSYIFVIPVDYTEEITVLLYRVQTDCITITISAPRLLLLPSLRVVSSPGPVEDQSPASNIGGPLTSIIDHQPPATCRVLAPVVSAHQRPGTEVGEAGEGVVQRPRGQQSRGCT